MTMSQFIGSWKLIESQNFDSLLSEMGVNFVLRKVARSVTPTVKISQNGDKWRFEVVTILKKSALEFKLGEEFVEKRLDGLEVRTIVVMEGDRIVQKQLANEARKLKEVIVTRWVEEDLLIVIAECNKVVSTRKYVKQ